MSENLPSSSPTAQLVHPSADWQRLLRVALLGTRQAPDALPTVSLPLTDAETDYREKQALLAAGALSLIRKAGFLPAPLAPANTLAAPPETQPTLGAVGASLLQQLLEGTHPALLGGFLEELQQHGRRVPHQLLVALLEYTRTRRDLHRPVALVLGQRGQWLAAQNPAWQVFLAASGGVPDAANWETGTTAERVAFLTLLRSADPEQARELLATTLPQEPAKNQATLLETLHQGLSATDTALLEHYLPSKSKEVRQTVSPLLARVPGSPLVERLWQRTEPLLRLKSTLLSKKLLVELPDMPWDKSWLTDAIEQRDVRFQGDKSTLLGQMLALVPPQRWAAHWRLSPAKLLDLAAATEWAALVFTGWAEAAILHKDTEWAGALLKWYVELPRKHPFTLPLAGLAQQLSVSQLTDLLLPLLDSAPDFSSEARWLPLLQMVPAPWPEHLTRRVVETLRQALSHPERLHRLQYAASQLLEYMARVVPAAQYNLCALPLQPLLADAPYLQNSLARLLNTLHFRQQLTEALAENPGPG